jgi:putative addiction module killer protein
MNTIQRTDEFDGWLKGLKDRTAKAKIIVRIQRAENGNFGDCKHFDCISEMRIDWGPGYRVYFAKDGDTIYVLLIGGDKDSQERDIKRAHEIWTSLKKRRPDCIASLPD